MQPTADSTRKPHRGSTRCLVIAIDVGTTFSGVSYAILEPGEVPKIHGVTRSVHITTALLTIARSPHLQLSWTRACRGKLKNTNHHVLRQVWGDESCRCGSRERIDPLESRGRRLDKNRAVASFSSAISAEHRRHLADRILPRFKLRLRPKSMKLDMNGMHLSPLPQNKSSTHVFGDFLSCMRSSSSFDLVF